RNKAGALPASTAPISAASSRWSADMANHHVQGFSGVGMTPSDWRLAESRTAGGDASTYKPITERLSVIGIYKALRAEAERYTNTGSHVCEYDADGDGFTAYRVRPPHVPNTFVAH